MNDKKEILVYITAISPFGNTGQNTFEKQFISQFMTTSNVQKNYNCFAFYPILKKKTNYIKTRSNEVSSKRQKLIKLFIWTISLFSNIPYFFIQE
jgi:hypothetical protein